MKKRRKPIIESQSNSQPRSGTSPSMEQYVEAIAHLLEADKVCSVSEIADVAQVSRPAASRAVRELVDRNLAVHKAYGYVDLTEEGQSLAERLTARHEALFEFFSDVLQYDEKTADEEACRLEHHLSDDLVDRLARVTEFLTGDPARAGEWSKRIKRAAVKRG